MVFNIFQVHTNQGVNLNFILCIELNDYFVMFLGDLRSICKALIQRVILNFYIYNNVT